MASTTTIINIILEIIVKLYDNYYNCILCISYLLGNNNNNNNILIK
jgi:hypothetical protein